MFFYTCFSVFDKKKSSWPIQALLGKSAFHSKISVGLCAKCGFLPRNDDHRIWELAIRFTQRITFRSFRKLILGIPAGRTSDQLKAWNQAHLARSKLAAKSTRKHQSLETRIETGDFLSIFAVSTLLSTVPRGPSSWALAVLRHGHLGVDLSRAGRPTQVCPWALVWALHSSLPSCASHWRGQSLLQSLWPPQSPYDDAKWCKMMLLRSSPYPLKRPSLRPQPSQDSAKASCGVMAPDALGGEPSQLNQENQNFSRHPSDRNRF